MNYCVISSNIWIATTIITHSAPFRRLIHQPICIPLLKLYEKLQLTKPIPRFEVFITISATEFLSAACNSPISFDTNPDNQRIRGLRINLLRVWEKLGAHCLFLARYPNYIWKYINRILPYLVLVTYSEPCCVTTRLIIQWMLNLVLCKLNIYSQTGL